MVKGFYSLITEFKWLTDFADFDTCKKRFLIVSVSFAKVDLCYEKHRQNLNSFKNDIPGVRIDRKKL